MGLALYYMGGAVLQYLIIQDRPGEVSGGCLSADRYLWAEADARLAHEMLHHVYTVLSSEHDLGSEIRKNCRQAKVLLSRERARAAAAIGIDPPPEENDDLQHDQIDHHGGGLDRRMDPPWEEQTRELIAGMLEGLKRRPREDVGPLLEGWERLAALTGQHQEALDAGSTPDEGLALISAWAPWELVRQGPVREEVRAALRHIRSAAREISETPDWATVEEQRELAVSGLVRLAALTGNLEAVGKVYAVVR